MTTKVSIFHYLGEFSMKLKILSAVLISVFVSGCGKAIDGKNANTMYESLSAIMKDMSEQEKKSLAQDLTLLFGHREMGMSEVGLSDLYDSLDYDVFVPGQVGKSEQLAFFRELLLGGTDLVTGKRAKDLRQDADEIRSQWFAGVLARRKEEKSAVLAALPELQNTLSEYQQRLAAVAVEEALLAQKKEQMNPTLDLTRIGPPKGSFYFYNVAEGRVRLTNTLDKSIDKVRVEVTLRKNAEDGKPAVFGVELGIRDGSLSTGESGETDAFALRLEKSASREVSEYAASSVAIKWVTFAGQSERFEFSPTGVSPAELWRLKSSAKHCEELLARITQYNEEIDAYLQGVQDLVDTPRDIDRLPPITSIGKREC